MPLTNKQMLEIFLKNKKFKNIKNRKLKKIKKKFKIPKIKILKIQKSKNLIINAHTIVHIYALQTTMHTDTEAR